MWKRIANIDKRSLLAGMLIVVGLTMIAYYYGTGGYTYFVQKELRQDWLKAVATAKSKIKQPPDDGLVTNSVGQKIFGRLKIPKLGLDVIVLEGTDRSTLTKGPGHIIGTSAPWERGNTAISGHRTTFGAPFANLGRLRGGDKLVLLTLGGDYIYKVTGRAVVRPDDVSVIGQDFRDRLTITTCDPPGSAAKRLTIWAEKDM